ncbi:hypothetical protein OQA88_8210 [Cercophora sp. LCS_1]
MALPDQLTTESRTMPLQPLSPEALAMRHIKLREELREIEKRFAQQADAERMVLDAGRTNIEEESERERHNILGSGQLRGEVAGVIEDVIAKKKALALKKLEEDFQKREAQRKESFDQAKQQHVLKWRNQCSAADLRVPPPPQPSLDRGPAHQQQQPHQAAKPTMATMEHHHSALPQQQHHQTDAPVARPPHSTPSYHLGPPQTQQTHQQHHGQESRYISPYAPPPQPTPLPSGPRMPHSHTVPMVPSQPLPPADRLVSHQQSFPILPSQPLPSTQRTPLPYGPQGMRPPPGNHGHGSHLPPVQLPSGLRAPEAAARYSTSAMSQHPSMEARDRPAAPPDHAMAYPQTRLPPADAVPAPPEPPVSRPVEVKWKAVNQGVPHHRPTTPLGRREPLTTLGGQDINQLASDHQKRKAANDETTVLPESASKRARNDADTSNGGPDQPSPRAKPAEEKTISFDDVFQGGNAKHKHIIVEYPPNSGKHYVLKCEEHGVHFNQNPLAGAAKHLHSAQHGNMTKERAQAVELLGYLVQDCDAALAEKNNKVVRKAFEEGYKPFNLNQLSKTARTSLGYGEPSTSGTQRIAPRSSANEQPNVMRRSSAGITDPVAGELYLVFWPKDKQQYPAILLPWGDLKCAGLLGNLAETGLVRSAPKCYVVDPVHQKIQGWASGYEDGGPLVAKREFPCYYFDGDRSVGWVRAKDLSNFDFHTQSWRDIPGFMDAANHYARKSGYADVTSMLGAFPATQSPALMPGNSAPSRTIAPAPAPAPAPRTDDCEMQDAAGAQAYESDRESEAPSRMDSDVDMANTESRRTSVSNKGESLGAGADKAAEARDSAALVSAATSAQLIAARALELPAPTRALPESDSLKVAAQPSRQSSTSGSENGRRRVEKIYASSNRNRGSNSPKLAPASQARVPSPASLQNILQSSNQPEAREHSRHRPGPLHQQSFLSEQRVRESPSPMLPHQRVPSPLPAPTPQSQPSAVQLEGLPAPQSAPAANPQPDGTEPPSRTSTPVIVTSVEASDRWRAVRADPAKALSSTKRLDSPRILSPLTPNPSIGSGTGPNSPNKVQSPGPGIKPDHVDGEVFDVSLLLEPEGEPYNVAKKGPVFQLTVDNATMSARSAADAETRLVVNPREIQQLIVEKTTSEAALAVRLVSQVQSNDERVLIFETSDTGKGMQHASLRMRRFCRWLTKTNPSAKYVNNSTSSRSASFTTA